MSVLTAEIAETAEKNKEGNWVKETKACGQFLT
jgi:hypothetical protein